MNPFLRVIRGNILHFSLLMVNCARPEALDFPQEGHSNKL